MKAKCLRLVQSHLKSKVHSSGVLWLRPGAMPTKRIVSILITILSSSIKIPRDIEHRQHAEATLTPAVGGRG